MKLVPLLKGIKEVFTIKSQKGYTLILVMIIISMIIILGAALSGIALNASKQVNTTNEHNKATNLAEMGVTYYLSVNNNLIQIVQSKVAANPDNFCSEFSAEIPVQSFYDKNQNVDGQNSYNIHFDSITPTCSTNPSELDVAFHSIGITGNGKRVPIQGKFKIQKTNTSEGAQAPFLSLDINNPIINNSTDVWVYSDFLRMKKQYPDTINGNTWFNDTLSLVGNAPLTITKDAVFDKNIEFNSHTSLTIDGDAVFRSLNPITKTDANATLCIKGKSYYLSPTGVLQNFPNVSDIIRGLALNYQGTLNQYPNILHDFNIISSDLLNLNNLLSSINNLITIDQCKDTNINEWKIDPQNGVVINYNPSN